MSTVHYLSFTQAADNGNSKEPSFHPAVALHSAAVATAGDEGQQPTNTPTRSTSADDSTLQVQGTSEDISQPSLAHYRACAAPLKEGCVYFLLGMVWWTRFKADERDPRLSPIDNACLLAVAEDSVAVGEGQRRLREGLRQEEDFVVLTPDAWRALQGRYGGGPAVLRRAVTGPAAGDVSLAPVDSSFSIASGLGEDGDNGSGFRKWTRLIGLPDCGAEGGQCFVCRRRGLNRCKNCCAVYYCGAACQKSHWPAHKKWCKSARQYAHLSAAEFSRALGLRRGRVGLANLGNTCFLSSALQCLSHIVPLTSYLLSGEYAGDLNRASRDGTGGALALKYELLLRELWFGDSPAFSPIEVRGEVGRKESLYRGLGQQDAHEFLERFLDWLQEDLNRVQNKPYCERPEGDGSDDGAVAAASRVKDRLRNDSVVNDVLGGQMRSQLECPCCHKLLVRFDYFHTVQLALPHSKGAQQQPAVALRVVWVSEAAEPQQLGERPIEYELWIEPAASVRELVSKLARAAAAEVVTPEDLVFAELWPRTRGGVTQFVFRGILDTGDADGLGVRRLCGSKGVIAVYHRPKRRGIPVLITQSVVDQASEAAAGVGFPVLVFVEERLTCARLRFLVWQQVRRGMKDAFWRTLLATANGASAAADDDGEDGARLAVNDIRLNTLVSSKLAVRCIDYDSASGREERPRVPAFDAHVSRPAPKQQASAAVVADWLAKDVFGSSAAPFLGSDLPADGGLTLAAALRNLDRDIDGAPLVLSVDWDVTRLAFVSVDEITRTSKSRAPPPPPSRPHELTLQRCLELFTTPEKLDEQNSWYCGQCAEHRQALKTVQLWRLPEVLVITLKRFEMREANSGSGSMSMGLGGFGSAWGGLGGAGNVKIDAPVDFPLNGLDLSSFCHAGAPLGPGGSTYDLFALCNHYGRMGFGHYTAYARDWEGPWLSSRWSCFDDESVTAASEDEIRAASRASYILFYRKRPVTNNKQS